MEMSKRPFFYHHILGFRRNPFGALDQSEWAAIAVLPPTLAGRPMSDFRHLQLLGPMGSGKTTTMHKLMEQFTQNGQRIKYEYLPPGERVFKTDTAVLGTFFLDEAQRLTRRERRRLLSAAVLGLRLVFSSHEDLTSLFHRWQQPLLSINLEEALTVDLYSQMLDRRLDYFALPDRPHTTLAADAVRWLYQTFYPNMRDAEYFLYEVWQKETAVREITAVHLINLKAEIG
jgi:hypothetical protein